MSGIALNDQVDDLTKLLRIIAASYPGVRPPALEAWWVREQAIITAEDAARAARTEQRRQELIAKIADLQATLDALS